MKLLGMSEEERLELEQAGVKPETLNKVVQSAAAQSEETLQRAIREVQEVIGPHGSISRVQAGGIRITPGEGMGVFSDGVHKTRVQPNGTLIVGSDIEEPSTTTEVFFTEDTDYNAESFGAGDFLIGDNSTGESNIWWDASEGKLNFRLGTTVHVYLDTDGTLKAGGGNVTLDSTGIKMVNSATSWFNFQDASGGYGTINIAADPNNDLEIVNFATSPKGKISFFIKTTDSTIERGLFLEEHSVTTNAVHVGMSMGSGGSVFSISDQVIFWAGVSGKESVINESGFDIDFRIESDTNPNFFKIDAGAESLSIDGAVTINDTGADKDFIVEGDTDEFLLFVDASTDRVGVGTSAPNYKLQVSGDVNITSAGNTYRIAGDDILAGWIPTTVTWTRTGNHTFTLSGDLTDAYRKGTKIRYKDGGSYEYGVIASSSHAAGTTTVTLITNTDYAMAAATITNKYLSYIENPEGFPQWFNYDAAPTGFSVVPPTPVYRWKVSGNQITLAYLEGSNGTSNATTFTATVPVASVYAVTGVAGTLVDNGALLTTAGRVTIGAGATSMILRTNMSTGAWTNTNGKRAVVTITYEF